MDFFNLDEQAESLQQGEPSPHQHSARNQALFKQEPPSTVNPRVSLSDYIAKHLGKDARVEPDSEPEQIEPPRFRASSLKKVVKSPRKALIGQRLNALDINMGSGLEQYLPTTIFRLRIMKKRLSDEINEIQTRLNKYERLPQASPEMKHRIFLMQDRLQEVIWHEQQVSAELSDLLATGPWLLRLGQQSESWQVGFSGLFRQLRQVWVTLLYGKQYLQVEQAQLELQSIQELMTDRLKDASVSDSEISQLLNTYESTLHQVESLTAKPKP